jgi:hypothetical protein
MLGAEGAPPKLGAEGRFGRAPGDGTFGAPLGGLGGRLGRGGASPGAPGGPSPPGGEGGAGCASTRAGNAVEINSDAIRPADSRPAGPVIMGSHLKRAAAITFEAPQHSAPNGNSARRPHQGIGRGPRIPE